MRLSSVLLALTSIILAAAQNFYAPVPGTTGELGDAAITTNNKAGVSYQALLADRYPTGIAAVQGYVTGTSNISISSIVT